jgi:pyrroloquinoline quinone biosynthesis protein D
VIDWLEQRPRVSEGARLRFDPLYESYILLSPERGLRLNASAAEVLRRCDGALTVREIVSALVGESDPLPPPEPTAQITADVLELLSALHERSLVSWDRRA